MKLRHQLLSQAKVYLHHNPGDANLTVDELRAMVGNLSSEYLMKRLQRYAANVQGSNQYWFQRHQKIRALLNQKGPPTFFWTVSSADTYWPELHNLMIHSPWNTANSSNVRAGSHQQSTHHRLVFLIQAVGLDRPLAVQDTRY